MKKNEKAASHYVEFIRFKTTSLISKSLLPEKFGKQCNTVAIDISALLMISPPFVLQIPLAAEQYFYARSLSLFICSCRNIKLFKYTFWDCKIYYFTPKINFPDKILLYLISWVPPLSLPHSGSILDSQESWNLVCSSLFFQCCEVQGSIFFLASCEPW